MVKLAFLGSGGGRVVVANQFRRTAGFFIKIGNHQICVDPGPGTLSNARFSGVNIPNTSIIFCSHTHIDHVGDLNSMADAVSLSGIKKSDCVLLSTEQVIKNSVENTPWLHPTYHKLLKELIQMKAGDKAKIDNLNFLATETHHDEELAIGFKLDSGNFTLGYTADTAYFEKLSSQFLNCDVLIANVLRPGNDMWATHMCSEDAIKLASEAKPNLMIITHFGAKMIRSNPYLEAKRIQEASGVRTIAAHDGLVMDV